MPGAAVVVAAVAILLASSGPAIADGTPDTSFGTGGRLTFESMTTLGEFPADIAIDSRGRILIAGTLSNATDPARGFIARVTGDGQLDTTFAAGTGIFTVGSATSVVLNAIDIDSQGRIVAGGAMASATDFDMLAIRIDSEGAFDPSFDGDGIATVNFGGTSSDFANDLAIDSQGRIVLAGYSTVTGSTAMSLLRLNPSGAIDPGFGGTGMVLPPLGGSFSAASGVAIDAAGRILAGGSLTVPGPDSDLLAVRVLPGGGMDPDFGGAGQVRIDFGTGPYESARDLAIDSAGRILLAGTTSLGDDNDTLLARITQSGSPDPDFGTSGRFRVTGTQSDVAFKLAIDQAGRPVTAGTLTREGGGAADGLLMRFSAIGAVDTSFGVSGFVSEDYGAAIATADALAIDPEGRYVIAGRYINGPTDRVGVARYKADYPVEPPPPPPPKIRCGGRVATIVGTGGADRLRGTKKRDVIAGLGGNDVIKGLAGNDLLCGGPGNDTLVAGPGNDTLDGGPGKDLLKGGPGKDRLIGGKGRDRCLGGPGKNRLTGCERRR